MRVCACVCVHEHSWLCGCFPDSIAPQQGSFFCWCDVCSDVKMWQYGFLEITVHLVYTVLSLLNIWLLGLFLLALFCCRCKDQLIHVRWYNWNRKHRPPKLLRIEVKCKLKVYGQIFWNPSVPNAHVADMCYYFYIFATVIVKQSLVQGVKPNLFQSSCFSYCVL